MVVVKELSTVNLQELKQFCMEQIAEYKIPTRLEIVEALARTSVGKVSKPAIKAQLRIFPSPPVPPK